MIRFYKNLFFLVYRFFKKNARRPGSDWNHAIVAVFIISTFEVLNVVSIVPSRLTYEGGELIAPYILLLSLNSMVFLALSRFRKIESQFLQNPPSMFNDSFVILYMAGTILAFGLTR